MAGNGLLYEVKMAGFAIYNDVTTTTDARWQIVSTSWQTIYEVENWQTIYEVEVPSEEPAPIPSIHGHRYWRKGVFVPNENKPMSKGLRIIIIQKPLRQNTEARKISRPRAPPDK